jgi:hypothetical protein
MKPDFDGPEDRQLADDIARVMHHRPLMSRLARVSPAPAPPPEPPKSPETSTGPANTVASANAEDPRSLDEMLDDLGFAAVPPPSAQWLSNARVAHRQARVRNAVAWATTLAIAVAIIGVALLLLRV